MRLWSRSLVALLVVLVAGALWPMTPAEAASNSFVDDDTSRFEPFIETAKEAGLVNGCNPPENDRVCPHHLVTRGNMAIMLARAIGAQTSQSDHFDDDDGHLAEGAIDALIDAGIPMSCDKAMVCPDRPITRGEMATLITRAFSWDHLGNPEQYLDLDGSPFRAALAKLADRGGLLTCDPPVNRRLCPDATVRRDEALYALIAVMRLQPTATVAQEPDLPPLGFGDGFDELSLWDGREPSSRNRVRLTDDGYRDNALRVGIPEGSHYGADFKLHLDDAADEVPEGLFFRYFVKFDEDWRTTSSGKLPGFSGVYGSSGKGGYRSSTARPGWSARLMFGPNHTTDNRIDLGYYVYHLGQETRYGDGLHWNEAGRLQPGDWYCLEGEVEMNTLGLADGALRAWVDGTPAFDISGLEFRRPSEPEIKIESFWFNVYYGGKAVAPQDLGLTIDEVVVDTHRVGCGAGEGTTTSGGGDFDGDGYRDQVWWDRCPGGTCFWLETTTESGKVVTRQNADGAWFGLETHRLGLATGDVDGDDRTDVVYRGRCDDSVPCWRVHDARGGMRAGENWGDDARFSAASTSLVLGDWNGDGFDDIAYRGICASDDRACWRVHLSSGDRFESPRSWGVPPDRAKTPIAADITGDGRDDLVYQAPCDENRCWFAQVSKQQGSFDAPIILGGVREGDGADLEWIDFDGDGISDLVSWKGNPESSKIEVRFMRTRHLGLTIPLAHFDREIQDVALRRLDERSPVQALVQLACKKDQSCVAYLVAPSAERLVDPTRFRFQGPAVDWIE